jgi:hypothetical protein
MLDFIVDKSGWPCGRKAEAQIAQSNKVSILKSFDTSKVFEGY